jgi:hypothetical protein
MAVTKRTRFEILRRDNHTCQYCGQSAPDVVLHIDHVIPVALGGSDDPNNLVTACKDCNAGKTSIQPDSPLVAKISDLSAAYALTMIDKLTKIRARLESQNEYVEEFDEVWNSWGTGEGDGRQTVPLPLEYKTGLRRWYLMGVPLELLKEAIDISMRTNKVELSDKFRYAAGVVWRTLDAEEVSYPLTPATAKTFTDSELETIAGDREYDGFMRGMSRQRVLDREQDILTHHIDGTSSPWLERFRQAG